MINVSEVRRTRTQWRAVWKVKRGRLEDETRSHAGLEAHWRQHGETAAVAHMCTRLPFLRSRTSYRVVCRRISGVVK